MRDKVQENINLSNIKNYIWENSKTFIYAIIIAIIIRSLIFEPFYIPSGSMKDNLLEGDFIVVSKYSYGYSKYSFPYKIIPISGRTSKKEPNRGDVIVFRLPSDPKINYIKRVIGLAGDKIQIKDSQLYLNDKKVQRVENGNYIDRNLSLAKKYIETLPSGKSYNILDHSAHALKDNTPSYIVPEGHYFFLGDNRDNSKDSRFIEDVGFVPRENLIGEAKYIFMSSQDSLLKFWQWHNNIRVSRIFKKIN